MRTGQNAALRCVLFLGAPGFVSAQSRIDYAVWEKYRAQVQHPATAIKPVDLERAKRNTALYPWAKDYVAELRAGADAALAKITPDDLARMIEHTTPGCVGPCPACRTQGLPWHPSGQWSWSDENPDQLTCSVCRTVFPNSAFPESVVLQSTWDLRQTFGFVGGEPFNCFGYLARPSLTGIIRARKLASATSRLQTLSVACSLLGDAKYARGTKAVLLRLADVLPKYLVRAGYAYGEYADCDPHIAAERIANLPTDELVVPPNRPDRKLHAAYWAASRIGSSGMDGGWVSRVAQAYDLTCDARDHGTPVYSDEERRRIERDVLLESAYLAACDPGINNKSVGNRAGAAMVGMCVGQPDLVSFGLDGFRKTVDGWFLPDGGTSESAAYALMTMGGIRNFGLMFRGYTDPPGYRSRDGSRIDDFDASRDTRYGDCWQDLIWTLQGDLRHPPTADSYRTTGIGAAFAELITLCYPTDEHVALLKELSRKDAPTSPSEAIFYREPGLESRAVPALSLPDAVFPFLSQGHLRTGASGRGSLALLNATDWGGHHHQDSLDLYYWKDGRELLSDLGYLWDHPDKRQTARTFAHNLVLLDGQEQRTRGRGGSFHLFATTPRVKVMEASSGAYAAASIYRRTVIQVDHGEAGSYLVDIFRAEGGGSRQFVLHGPGNDYEVKGLALAPVAPESNRPIPSTLPSAAPPLENARTAPGSGPWQATWRLGNDYTFTALAPGDERENVTIGDGWGQRDHRNTDRGAKLPYVIRASRGEGLDQFVTVFAGGPAAKPLAKSVRRLPLPTGAPADAVVLAMETALGTDIIVSMLTPAPLRIATPLGELACDGRVAAILGNRQQPRETALFGGTRLELAGVALSCPRATCGGKISDVGSAPGESWFVLEGGLPKDVNGQTLFVQDGEMRRGYPIREVRVVDGRTRVYTKANQAGFEARPGQSWELVTAVWR
ncbi:MAG: heparinase II/III family protein [Verrucomicrobia bacterium]|nr:heparinase II/III family protein [Verrucomicrobiota bacterium]